MGKGKDQLQLQEYWERHRFWADAGIRQVGYTLNLFITFTSAFTAYLLSLINDQNPFTYPTCILTSAMILAVVSLFAGLIGVISRLYDIRLTRHLMHVREVFFDVTGKRLDRNFIDTKYVWPILVLIQIVWKINWIRTNSIQKNRDAANSEVKKRFHELARQSKILGKCTWRSLIIQVISFGLSFVVFVVWYLFKGSTP